MKTITLLTDFGLSDTYVGQLHATLHALAPGTAIVDLTHAVPPQDVQAGAFLLWTAVEAAAPGSIHVAVVDPGVGSARRAVVLRAARGDRLVGPDNGLLWPALERLGGLVEAAALPIPPDAAATFHGRDVFAPAAARLARGAALADLGPTCVDLVQLTWPTPTSDQGEVLHVDTYGNLVTNFPSATLPAQCIVRVGETVIPLVGHYAAVARDTLLALVGSAGLLEISVRDGSAAARLGAARGTRVWVGSA